LLSGHLTRILDSPLGGGRRCYGTLGNEYARTDHTSRAQPSRTHAAARHVGEICCAALAIACGGGGSEPPQIEQLSPAPALESIAYERLGSGKLAFRRVSDGNYLYVIDATARTVATLSV